MKAHLELSTNMAAKYIALTLSALYVVMLSVMSTAHAPDAIHGNGFWPNIYDKPIGEDGFYMLTISWNLAQTGRFEYNLGDVSTGIQPLMTVIMASVAKVVQILGFDKEAFARAIIIFNGAALLLFALMIRRLTVNFSKSTAGEANAETAGDIALVLTLTSFYIFRTFLYGLETGAYLIGIAAVSLFLFGRNSLGEVAWRFGLVAGVVGLARIDFGVLLATFFVVTLIMRRAGLTDLVKAGLTALTLVSPWLFFVHVQTGSFIPSSGGAQASLISLANFSSRIEHMAMAIVQNLMPSIFVVGRTPTFIFATGALLLVLFAGVKKMAARRVPKLLLIFWGSLLILPLIYVTFFWAAHFYARYLAPLMVPALVISSSLITQIASSAAARISLYSGAILLFTAFAGYSLHTGRLGNSHTITAYFIRENYSDVHYLVGAFQSGVVGFLNENVINLDGKIDSSALENLRAGQIDRYISERGINVIVDWPDAITIIDDNYLEANFMRCPTDIPAGYSHCYIRR